MSALNPARLQDTDPTEPVHHLEVTGLIQSLCSDLTDVLLETPDKVLCIDVSSFIRD